MAIQNDTQAHLERLLDRYAAAWSAVEEIRLEQRRVSELDLQLREAEAAAELSRSYAELCRVCPKDTETLGAARW